MAEGERGGVGVCCESSGILTGDGAGQLSSQSVYGVGAGEEKSKSARIWGFRAAEGVASQRARSRRRRRWRRLITAATAPAPVRLRWCKSATSHAPVLRTAQCSSGFGPAGGDQHSVPRKRGKGRVACPGVGFIYFILILILTRFCSSVFLLG